MTAEKKVTVDETVKASNPEDFDKQKAAAMERVGAKIVEEKAFEVIITGDLVEVEHEGKPAKGAMVQIQSKGNPIDLAQSFGSVVATIAKSIVEKSSSGNPLMDMIIGESLKKKLAEEVLMVAMTGFKNTEGTIATSSMAGSDEDSNEECDCERCQMLRKVEQAAKESGGVVSVNPPVKDPQ
jgi:hypothetical protein